MPNPNVSIPKGTRDFLPNQMVKREFIFTTIKNIFQRYGFLPLETPAMEKLSVLSGKYGEEGEKLIFKILDNGDFLSNLPDKNINSLTSAQITPFISEKALRYDLTVPLARVIAMNQHAITFPFRRYQIQPVWRADRPQKSRYREFFQCDVDVIGSESLFNEAELIKIIDDVTANLNLKEVSIKINNRKILTGICETIGFISKEAVICSVIDKFEKIGISEVLSELINIGLNDAAIKMIEQFLSLNGNAKDYIPNLKALLQKSEIGMAGINELEIVVDYTNKLNLQNAKLKLTPALARGLNYYTGTIFETAANNVNIGSIAGGGRYDKLIGLFLKQNIPAVGISFGVDRIFDVMEELKLFPENLSTTTKVLITYFDDEMISFALSCLSQIRAAAINTEIYPEASKIKKQLDYANKKGIPYIIIIGPDELKANKLTLKDMKTGVQETITLNEIINKLKG